MTTPAEAAQYIVNKSVTRFSLEPSALLVRFLVEVLEWNSVLGLVSRKDPRSACERLLCESLELGRLLDIGSVQRAADVGSGAGFPGLVWGLVHPHMELTLIERRQRRAVFLERTALTLGASNVAVLAEDLRAVSREMTFDLVATMAVGDPVELAADVERMLDDGGRFASTVPRESAIPERLGSRLRLDRRVDGEFGCYVIYRSGV